MAPTATVAIEEPTEATVPKAPGISDPMVPRKPAARTPPAVLRGLRRIVNYDFGYTGGWGDSYYRLRVG